LVAGAATKRRDEPQTPPNPGNEKEEADPPDAPPSGDGSHGRLESGVEPAVRCDQVHLIQAGVVRQTGKRVERSRLLEVHALDRAGPRHLQESPRARVAKLTEPIVQDDVAARRR